MSRSPPTGGRRYASLTRQEIEEVYELRAELEGYAAYLACVRADDDFDRRLIEASSDVQTRAHPGPERDVCDRQLNVEVSESIRGFHHIIQETAGNATLVSVIRDLEALFLGSYCSHEMADPGVAERLHVDEHRGIQDALLARNAAAARELMRAHILHAKRILLDYLDNTGFWAGHDDTDNQEQPNE